MDDREYYTPQQIRGFQELLLAARRSRHLTQTEVARRVGVSQTLISSLERGPSMGMRVGDLFRVLAFYGIEANEVQAVLGYLDYTPHRENDPRVTRLFDILNAVPDEMLDRILDALDLMGRGASIRTA